MLSIGNLAIQLTTPLLLRKPCKLFASVARVCQRQLGFLVLNGMHYINSCFTYVLTCTLANASPPVSSFVWFYVLCSRLNSVSWLLVGFLIRGHHMAVFILARISSPNVNNCPRHSRGQLSIEGVI